MKKLCDEVQNLLAADGAEALAYNREAKDHLSECAECFAFLESLEHLDSSLTALPEHDASDALVEQVLSELPKHEIEHPRPAQRRPAGSRFPVWQVLRLPSSRALATILSVFLAVIVSSFTVNTFKQRTVRQSEMAPKQGIGAEEDSGDLIQAFKQEMDQSKTEQAEQAAVITRLKGDLNGNTERTAGVFESLVDRVDQLSGDIDRLAQNMRQQPQDANVEPPDTVEKYWEEGSSTDELKPALQGKETADMDAEVRPQIGQVIKQRPQREETEQRLPVEYTQGAAFAGGGEESADFDKSAGNSAPAELEDDEAMKTAMATSQPILREPRADNAEHAQTTQDGARPPSAPKPSQQIHDKEQAAADKKDLGGGKYYREGSNKLVATHALRGATAAEPTVEIDKNNPLSIMHDKRTDGFLGKTNEQNDPDVVENFWNDPELQTSKMANPDRAQAYRDKEESGPVELQAKQIDELKKSGSNSDDLMDTFEFWTQRYVGKEAGPNWWAQRSDGKEAGPKAKNANTKSPELFRSTAGLHFQEASGYWANTYVPGDPTIRRLNTTLLGKDRAQLEQLLGRPLKLHEMADQPDQPFDVPENQSIGLNIHSDRSSLQGEGRMLIQIGMKGTERSLGRRPAMNLGIVLDLRGTLSAETADRIRELLFALNDAKDIGDTFRVTVAGRPGGIIIPAADFKRGALTVKLQEVLNAATPQGADSLDLAAAYEQTLADVAAADDPNSALGSSEMIVVTDQPLGGSAPALQALAQKSAVSGIPTSVVALGDRADLSEIDNLVLSGQGNRRVMQSKDQAKDVVSRELASVSRAVAKAIRLRIRLAPGVKLVNVIGSYRLDMQHATEVKEAEKSIDRRLAKNLGIESDRGDDEDGIQIVIPSFYSGDTHVILLDVVASGSGPIAEVRARYKDLVHLKNAVVTDSLSIPGGESQQGALEQNVLKNFLALELSNTLGHASTFVERGNFPQALALASNYQTLLESAQTGFPKLMRDPSIETDTAMLAEYVAVLRQGARANASQRQYLAESLAYAAKRKVLPSPQQ